MSNTRRKITSRIMLFVLALFLLLAAQNRCFKKVEEILEEETFNTYSQINEKTAIDIEKKTVNIFNELKELAIITESLVQSGATSQEIIKDIGQYQNIINTKCVNYLAPRGIAYCSNGDVFDFTDNKYYPLILTKSEFVTPAFDYESYSKEKIIIFSKRIEDVSGKYIGTVFFDYTITELADYLSIKDDYTSGEIPLFLNGEYEAIFEKDTETLIQFYEVFSGLESNDKEFLFTFDDEEVISNRTVDKDGNLIVVSPVSINSKNGKLFVTTIVDKEIYLKRVKEAKSHISKMLSITFFISAIFLIYMFALLIKKTKKDEDHLKDIAFTDLETGGHNLKYFNKMFDDKKDEKGYIVAADLAKFTNISNLYPEHEVYKIIMDVYDIIRRSVSDNDIIAHDQRDQYALYIDEDVKAELENKLTSINEKLLVYSSTKGYPEIKLIFGLKKYTSEKAISYLYAEAKTVLKKTDDNQKQIFKYAIEDSYVNAERNEKIASKFFDLLNQKKFYLDYQPIFSADNGRVLSAEAFIRYKDENNNVVYPNDFIGVLEENGYIQDLDNYVFINIVEFIKKQMENGNKILPISMNISRYTLYQRNTIANYLNYAKNRGVDLALIPLEIRDENIKNDDRLMEAIVDLKSKGFKVQIDRFGRNGSSLIALSKCDFDVVKLDKSVIDEIGVKSSEFVLRHLTSLGSELGLDIIAFGVENELQAEFVKNLGVSMIQGPYYSAPISEADFNEILNHYYDQKLFEEVRYEELTRYSIVQTFESPLFSDEAISFMTGPILKMGLKDNDLYLMGSNNNAEKLLGLNLKSLLHSREYSLVKEFTYDEDYETLKNLVIKAYETKAPTLGKLIFKQDEMILPVLCKIFIKKEHNGYKEVFAFISLDNKEMVDTEFINHMPGGLLVYQPNDEQKIIKINKEFLKMTGYESEEAFYASNNSKLRELIYVQDYHVVINSMFMQFFSTNDKQARVKFRITRADGKLIYISMHAKYFINNIYGDLIYCYIESLEGQNEAILNEENAVEKLKYESTHDGLTGLYNQASVKEMANELFKNNPNIEFTLLVMDIDNFKQFNDNHGHAFGDNVIKTFALVLKSCVSGSGFCARIGGDEFIAIEPQIKETTEQIAQRIFNKLHFSIEDCVVTPSIGVTSTLITEKKYEEMFLNADLSLYASKNSGKDSYTIYSPNKDINIANKESGRVNTFDLTRVIQTINVVGGFKNSNLFVWDFRAHKINVTQNVMNLFNFESATVNAKYLEDNVIFNADTELIRKEIAELATGKKEKHEIVYRWLNKDRKPVWIKCQGSVIKNNEKPLCLIGEIKLIAK